MKASSSWVALEKVVLIVHSAPLFCLESRTPTASSPAFSWVRSGALFVVTAELDKVIISENTLDNQAQ